jgi:glycolate oxidase
MRLSEVIEATGAKPVNIHAPEAVAVTGVCIDSRVVEAGDEILALCLREGGSLTGEHGIGVEKCAMMRQMFSQADLETMKRIKAVFNPQDRLNPEKLFPDTRYCYESKRRLRQRAASV